MLSETLHKKYDLYLFFGSLCTFVIAFPQKKQPLYQKYGLATGYKISKTLLKSFPKQPKPCNTHSRMGSKTRNNAIFSRYFLATKLFA